MVYSSSPIRVPTLEEMVERVSETLSIDRSTVLEVFNSGNSEEYRKMVASYFSAKGRKLPISLASDVAGVREEDSSQKED